MAKLEDLIVLNIFGHKHTQECLILWVHFFMEVSTGTTIHDDDDDEWCRIGITIGDQFYEVPVGTRTYQHWEDVCSPHVKTINQSFNECLDIAKIRVKAQAMEAVS